MFVSREEGLRSIVVRNRPWTQYSVQHSALSGGDCQTNPVMAAATIPARMAVSQTAHMVITFSQSKKNKLLLRDKGCQIFGARTSSFELRSKSPRK